MKILKSYKAFTPLVYRLVIFALLPMMVIMLGILGNVRRGEEFIFIVPLICIVEIVADHWIFGGIHLKNVSKMDYLKGSNYGIQFIRNVLWMDQVRRFIETMLIIILFYFLQYKVINQNNDMFYSVLSYLVIAIMVYTLTSLGIYITRFGEAIWLNIIICNIFSILASILYWVSINMLQYAAVIWSVSAVFVAILSVKTAEKKVRDSYYD